jgi:hypothetical protein
MVKHKEMLLLRLLGAIGFQWALEVEVQWGKGFFFFCIWVRFFIYMHVTPAVLYLFTGLTGCSVDFEINHDARKLVRTFRII